jgi:hypothetical protein|tara:strand:- start:3680 stop:4606 length:927 start_codon:yes stop_codon:yes gene_type:complete
MKICKIIWSTNRLEFLIPTLETSKEFIDWGDHEVDGIFIDDMPTDRDDETLKFLAESHGYNYVRLHEKNLGLTNSWKASYEILKNINKDYDFVWHQEDDLIIKDHIKINDLIKYLNENEECFQVALPYQFNWYWPDHPEGQYIHQLPLVEWNNFHTVSSDYFGNGTFDTSFSLTKTKPLFNALKMWKSGKLPQLDSIRMVELKDHILCEGGLFQVMGAYKGFLKNKNSIINDWCISFYSKDKKNYIEHIGEWSWGQRTGIETFQRKLKEVEENPNAFPPGYLYQMEHFKLMAKNPSTKINSRTWEKLS